jgi:choline dehydrogenase-like flavoprotein
MSWDIKNLMINDASVIPNALSSNPNAMIMAVSSRASDYVNHNILGAKTALTAAQEMAEMEKEMEKIRLDTEKRKDPA